MSHNNRLDSERMNRRQVLGMAGAATAGLVMGQGCTTTAAEHEAAAAKPIEHDHSKHVYHAVALMQPTQGSKTAGTVTFTQASAGVKVEANITGLEPNAKHAIHIHEFGDISKPDGMGTGGHYNPEGHEHGLPDQEKRHAGDLGNLEADAEGKCTYTLVVTNITVDGHRNVILGRGVIIHAKVDDGGQPVGNAGARIAQGVIGVAKAPEGAKPAAAAPKTDAEKLAGLTPKAESCCGKAVAKGETCPHECCAEALAQGTLCSKCNK